MKSLFKNQISYTIYPTSFNYYTINVFIYVLFDSHNNGTLTGMVGHQWSHRERKGLVSQSYVSANIMSATYSLISLGTPHTRLKV